MDAMAYIFLSLQALNTMFPRWLSINVYLIVYHSGFEWLHVFEKDRRQQGSDRHQRLIPFFLVAFDMYINRNINDETPMNTKAYFSVFLEKI